MSIFFIISENKFKLFQPFIPNQVMIELWYQQQSTWYMGKIVEGQYPVEKGSQYLEKTIKIVVNWVIWENNE